jgi:hypothetical protein
MFQCNFLCLPGIVPSGMYVRVAEAFNPIDEGERVPDVSAKNYFSR